MISWLAANVAVCSTVKAGVACAVCSGSQMATMTYGTSSDPTGTLLWYPPIWLHVSDPSKVMTVDSGK